MSIFSKAIVTTLFFSLIVGIIAALPAAADYPLPSEFSSSLVYIFGLVYAWSGVFTCIVTLGVCAGLAIGLELAIVLWKCASWVIGFVARFIG